jgi:hypothetical protein
MAMPKGPVAASPQTFRDGHEARKDFGEDILRFAVLKGFFWQQMGGLP